MDQSTINDLRGLVSALETNSVTSKEIKAGAVAALGLVNPAEPYGKDLFEALARITLTPNIELVILRTSEDLSQEVLLRRRGSDETYPGQWHAPGSTIRPGETIMKAVERAARECGGVSLTAPVFRGYYNNTEEERGHFFQLIYVVDVTGIAIATGPKLKWFPVDALPVPTVENHCQVVIPMALGRYGPHGSLESFAF